MTPLAEEIRLALVTRLSERAYSHSLAVAETAVLLASHYGVDSEDAYLAGLAHDWAREDGTERLLQAAARHQLEIGEVDRAVPYLLHARVGACEVREAFPHVPQRILTAVERHTVGAPDMSDLDMVLYLADVLEPARSHPGAHAQRKAVGEVPLLELFTQAYTASVAHLLECRTYMHPVTIEVWNALIDRGAAR